MNKRVRWYLFGLFIAFDQFINALFAGYPDETVSFRAANARDEGKRWGCVLCRLLDAIDRNHCRMAQRSKMASMIRRGMV
jgi:hypothetical protein